MLCFNIAILFISALSCTSSGHILYIKTSKVKYYIDYVVYLAAKNLVTNVTAKRFFWILIILRFFTYNFGLGPIDKWEAIKDHV